MHGKSFVNTIYFTDHKVLLAKLLVVVVWSYCRCAASSGKLRTLPVANFDHDPNKLCNNFMVKFWGLYYLEFLA